MSFELGILDIHGYKDREIRNSLLKQEKGPGPISILFPGLHYNAYMPLLYYSIGVLLETGHSVLSLDTRYSGEEEFMTISDEERTKWMIKDAEAVFDAVQNLDGFTLSVLVGKSLGTIQMSHLVQTYSEVQKCKIVWMTPLLKQDWIVNQMIAHQGESLVVIGTSDPHYNDDTLAKIVGSGRSELMAIMHGNHSLDVPSGVLDSMEWQSAIMSKMKNFVE